MKMQKLRGLVVLFIQNVNSSVFYGTSLHCHFRSWRFWEAMVQFFQQYIIQTEDIASIALSIHLSFCL